MVHTETMSHMVFKDFKCLSCFLGPSLAMPRRVKSQERFCYQWLTGSVGGTRQQKNQTPPPKWLSMAGRWCRLHLARRLAALAENSTQLVVSLERQYDVLTVERPPTERGLHTWCGLPLTACRLAESRNWGWLETLRR